MQEVLSKCELLLSLSGILVLASLRQGLGLGQGLGLACRRSPLLQEVRCRMSQVSYPSGISVALKTGLPELVCLLLLYLHTSVSSPDRPRKFLRLVQG